MAVRIVALMSPGARQYRAARARSISICTVGWPSEVKTARSVMPGTVASTALILLAVSDSACRSLPNNLMEFSPLTPDTASATLSWRYCEKLNSTPGKSVSSLGRICVVSASFSRPGRHLLAGLNRRKKFGVEKAGGIGPVVRAPVLRHDRFDLRKAGDHGAHPIDVVVAFFERDRRRHRRPDPQVALFELGQEFEPERADGQTREQQQ